MSAEREIIIENHEDNSSVDDNVQFQEYKVNIPVSNASVKAQTYLEYIYKLEDDDARQDLYDLINKFLSQDQQSGDADDFHNFAVDLARRDEYALACQIIECGLKLFPKNVDLLSDYLQYGVSCNKLEECKKMYKTLVKIPRRRWTWRGFAFLIDYLQFLVDRSDSEKEIDAKEEEMLSVVSDFKKQFPYSEDSYRTEANVYRSLNMPDKETEALKQALEHLRIAPKCALRYADIMFERGLYEEASVAIRRAISDATQTQTSVNEGYLYYLSALCKIATSQKTNMDLDLDEDAVEAIYSDFNIALSKFQDTKNSYIDVIRTKTNTIINKTGIEVDPKYDLLCEYLDN
ncbi:MAG: hypothetical protein E7571_00245 [Ruminococcaceae bacterium]|nr:hypothetical protein [Oscillospiraceae bacterium]